MARTGSIKATLLSIIVSISLVGASEKKKEEYGVALDPEEYDVRFSGYFRTDYNFDTRELNYSREGFSFLFPLPKVFDATCADINDRGLAHLLSIGTRTRAEVRVPVKPWRANLYGMIETDFSGPAVVDNSSGAQVLNYSVIDGLVVRHIFSQFNWKDTSLLIGQYWHPMFPIESAGNHTISLITNPLEPLSRNPQVRVTHRFSEQFELIGAIADQMSFRSNGPTGFSTKYMRNAIIPNIHLQTRFYLGPILIGIAGDYKRLIPRLFTQPADSSLKFKTIAGVDSFSALFYVVGDHGRLNWSLKAAYADNLTDMGMLGGYGISSFDPSTGHEEYTSLASVSGIGEIYYKGKIEPGLVIGFTKNVGARRKNLYSFNEPPFFVGNNQFVIFGRGSPPLDSQGDAAVTNIISAASSTNNTIDYIVGVIPRIKWQVNPVTVAFEMYFSRAMYGTLDASGRSDSCPRIPANSMRFTLAFFYFF